MILFQYPQVAPTITPAQTSTRLTATLSTLALGPPTTRARGTRPTPPTPGRGVSRGSPPNNNLI